MSENKGPRGVFRALWACPLLSVLLLALPVTPGDAFVQVDKTIDVGSDIDGDDRHEALTIRSQVTVQGLETVSTPAGQFASSAHVHTVITETLIYSASGRDEVYVVTL